MDTTGLEPVTPTMSTWCSNQLSYASLTIYHRSMEIWALASIFRKKADVSPGQLELIRENLLAKGGLDCCENLVIEGKVYLGLMLLAG